MLAVAWTRDKPPTKGPEPPGRAHPRPALLSIPAPSLLLRTIPFSGAGDHRLLCGVPEVQPHRSEYWLLV